jgi:uncharacterized protein (UPF0264 family)
MSPRPQFPPAAARPRPPFHGLLVSVRTAAEAQAAIAGGAAIVDVKEPAAGPLGAASAARAVAVAVAVAGRRPWTLACGELAAGPQAATARVRRVVAGCGDRVSPPAAAKAGPAGLDLRGWSRRFAAFQQALPPGIEPIAVAYADSRRADAPAPGRIIVAAADAGCRMLLIDTFDKRGPRLLDGGLHPVACWLGAAAAQGLAVALAGRVALADVPTLAVLGADVVAMRGSVCRGGRRGAVDRRLVAMASRLWERADRLERFPLAATPRGVARS